MRSDLGFGSVSPHLSSISFLSCLSFSSIVQLLSLILSLSLFLTVFYFYSAFNYQFVSSNISMKIEERFSFFMICLIREEVR